jgi:hypothetical protein
MGVWGNTTEQWRSLVIKHAGTDIPPAYVLNLIDYESGGNAQDVNPTSNATGLLQITKVALQGFNQAHGTSYALADMLDPDLNLQVGIDLIRRIISSYGAHPASLSPDWQSARWVALLTLGWNAGYSERAGVGYVVGKLEAAGIEPARITVDTVSQLATKLPDASRYLAMPDRVKWAKRVTQAYAGSSGGSQAGTGAGAGNGGGRSMTPYIVAGVAVVGVGGYLLYRNYQKQKREEEHLLREMEREEQAEAHQAQLPHHPHYVMVPMQEARR